MNTCKIEGCTEKYYGREYCRPHYRWFVEAGHTELAKTACDECGSALTNAHRRTRFCGKACQMRWHRKHGCYTSSAIIEKRGTCSIDGCGEAVHAHGWCRKHAMRKWRHGSPDSPIRSTVPCTIAGCARDGGYGGLCPPHYFRQYLNDHRAELYANMNARRSRVRDATPGWADMAAIRRIYRKCAEITIETGVEHHVDHVVPLKGRSVCGLHVAENLQVIPGADNRRKSNCFNALSALD